MTNWSWFSPSYANGGRPSAMTERVKGSVGTSAWVMTAATPGKALAPEVSIDTTRACA
jgi:hypothetical protein